MPKLVHASWSGEHKALVAGMKPGESHVVASSRIAHTLYGSARRLGLRMSIRQLARGNPCQRITLLPGRKGDAA